MSIRDISSITRLTRKKVFNFKGVLNYNLQKLLRRYMFQRVIYEGNSKGFFELKKWNSEFCVAWGKKMGVYSHLMFCCEV